MLNKPSLEKNSYQLTEKRKKLLLNIDSDITEPSVQLQDTPSKYFTARETGNCGNKLLAFKKYIIKECNDLKNRLEVLNNLGNASYSHGATAILKEEIQFLREGNKNKRIIMQDIKENENLFLQNKDDRNIQYNTSVNNNKSNFPSDEIFISYSKTFKMSKNTRNNKETNNVRLTNYFQALATANNIEDNIDVRFNLSPTSE